jgi:uncharacterized protein YlxW (UPF0749 family)
MSGPADETVTRPTSRRAARVGAAPPRRLDASMTLLREVMDRPLDPGYAAAAVRRAAGGPPSGRALTALVAVVSGLLFTWSVVLLRQPEPAAVRARAALEQQIRQRTDESDATRARIESYRKQIRQAQELALARNGDAAAAARARALGIASGEDAVTGPGLVIEIDDAPGSRNDGGSNADPRGDSSADDGRVYDRDLQTIVNGLWGADAEAIEIDGQRLTSLSAIRSAGEAILVDFRPLVPPYVIKAIGDPTSLQTRFVAGDGGAYLQSLRDNFGVQARLTTGNQVAVAGSGSLALRSARPLPAATATTPVAPATGSATLPSASAAPPARSSRPEASP